MSRYDEAQEASTRLLASLDELRKRADNFLTVAASTSTMLATLARLDRQPAPPQNDAGPTETPGPVSDRPFLDEAPLGPTGNVVLRCPVTAPRDAAPALDAVPAPAPAPVPVPAAERGRSAVEPVMAPAITSPNLVSVTAGTPFSFTVTTTGAPVPWITEKGDRPKHFVFADNGDGTATMSGTPRKTGAYHIAFRAKFGRGTLKYLVIQAFTLTVVAG